MKNISERKIKYLGIQFFFDAHIHKTLINENFKTELKKHAANFENLIPDLKSARKTENKTVYFQTRYFFSILSIGKQHCEM